MEKRTLTCINCPLGCQIDVILDGGAVQSITGNTCKRGAEYAEKEVTHPTRIVTTSVAVTGSKTGAHTVSCKTGEMPAALMAVSSELSPRLPNVISEERRMASGKA